MHTRPFKLDCYTYYAFSPREQFARWLYCLQHSHLWERDYQVQDGYGSTVGSAGQYRWRCVICDASTFAVHMPKGTLNTP